jgi:hypothetical protein
VIERLKLLYDRVMKMQVHVQDEDASVQKGEHQAEIRKEHRARTGPQQVELGR